MYNCPTNINVFCYCCGRFTPASEKHGSISDDFTVAYRHYFDREVILNVPWAPNIVCRACYVGLVNWLHKKQSRMPFGMPMIWHNPEEHDPKNCYSCANTVIGLNKKKAKNKKYVSVQCVQLPLDHNENIPVPKCPNFDALSEYFSVMAQPSLFDIHSEYVPEPSTSDQPILITQSKLDEIVAKLELTQRKSEILASMLKSNNLLERGTKVTAYRNRKEQFNHCFTVNEEKTFAHCHNIVKLMSEMGIKYSPDDWRLFIDSSKFSLKAVLLDKTNSKPSVPIAYGTDTKETFEKMDRILKLVDYQNHNWRVCCDLKVIAMLTGLQVGYIKHMCFLCDWDSRYKGDQYQKNDWKMRDESEKKDANRIHKELVSSKKIILPPLHIKLGIVKNFLMVVAKRDEGFSCLRDIFPKISDAKLKNGVLNGPDIRKLVKSEDFNRVLINNEIVAWESLKEIIVGLLGKHRSPNYKESVRRMLDAFSKIGVHMSLKIHFLHQHLDYFSQQLSTESDEQGERYHQTAMPFESRYRGKRAPGAILAEICWWSKHIFQYDQEENEGKWSNQEEKEYEVEEEETGMEFFTDESDYSDNDDVEIQSLSKRARL